jgi:hypothetical protein
MPSACASRRCFSFSFHIAVDGAYRRHVTSGLRLWFTAQAEAVVLRQWLCGASLSTDDEPTAAFAAVLPPVLAAHANSGA